MIGKMVLPIMGGSPATWNTCMVFYQGALLAGYTWAHLGSTRLALHWHCIVQIVLLGSLFWFLPITIPADLQVPVSRGIVPALWLCKVLIVAAGLPFFVIATMTPTLQRWFSQCGHRSSSDPYVLYATSNAGSLLGLLSYPWIVEPWLSLTRQASVWATGAAVLAVLTLAAAVWAWRREVQTAMPANENRCADVARGGSSSRQVGKWILLAFVTSSWLLGVTAYISTDLAPVPLLWTVPLGIYLLTYILAFAPGSERWTRAAAALLPLLVVPLVMVLGAGFTHLFWIPLHLLAFFAGALACHCRLAATRPGPEHATAFYLAIALGGVLGGLFNALVAPLVFDRLVEYPLVIVLAYLAAQGGIRPLEARRPAAGSWILFCQC